MRDRTLRLASLLLAGTATPIGLAAVHAQSTPATSEASKPSDALLEGFRNPPKAARPHAWWHWMNGNVTEAGIKADLDWMHRMGIGGVTFFDAGAILSPPDFIEPRVTVGDDRWKSAVALAARTADGYGMEFSTAASPGWSITGGPWVKPEQAMKKYVWSETLLQGGRPFDGKLAAPPTTTGPFQNVGKGGGLGSAPPGPVFYADALVVAYRVSPAEARAQSPVAVTSTSGPLDPAKLTDGDIATVQTITGPADESSPWVVVSYAKPVTVRAISLGIAGRAASDSDQKPRIEISNDGRVWRPGATLSGPADAPLKTYGFAPLTAKHFRVTLPPEPTPPAYEAFAPRRGPGPIKISLSELILHGEGTVDRYVEKAGFSDPIVYAAAGSQPVSADAAIAANDVVDLTGRMAPDGTLKWTPPPGRWRVIRMGYSLTGRENNPAPAEGTGLEVDKFSARHVRDYLGTYLGRFESALGRDMIGNRGLTSLVTDSWEAGTQNWTDEMRVEFRNRRGYDMAPWLPVLTGRIVVSAEASDRFLWDFRRTLQDLLAQHYAVLREELTKLGMGFYAEAQGDNWRAIGDGMEIKSRADIPMAEYWYQTFAAGPGQPSLKTDMKEAASVAHLYGKPLVANESLTVASKTPWGYPPSKLKPVIDEIFAYGINRFVLHSADHQPDPTRKPGIALGPFGQYLNRNETWAEEARPFFDYIARASFLLQQGHYVADIAYFYGEDRPLVSLFQGKYDEEHDRYQVEIPQGHGYDFINAETLFKASDVADGQLTSSGGMHYRILYLGPDTRAMTLNMLRRLEALATKGAVIVGDRPMTRLGLDGSDQELAAITDRLWGAEGTMRAIGKGKVYATSDISAALAAEGIAADVSYGSRDANMLQLHRRTDDGQDIYFLVNRGETGTFEASFRTAGRIPELWDANTGQTSPLSYRIEDDRTIVPVQLEAKDSAFIVFRKPATAQRLSIAAPVRTALAQIEGPWTVNFPADLGAPPKIELSALSSWSESNDPGVRYFSGTGTYNRTIDVPADWLRTNRHIFLNLGDVREVAQVAINGRDLGIVWRSPYQVDLTPALRAGRNALEIRVTNLWPNRIIGDLQPGVTKKYTWAPYSPIFARSQWKADSVLMPSGLLGPVTIEAEDGRK